MQSISRFGRRTVAITGLIAFHLLGKSQVQTQTTAAATKPVSTIWQERRQRTFGSWPGDWEKVRDRTAH